MITALFYKKNVLWRIRNKNNRAGLINRINFYFYTPLD